MGRHRLLRLARKADFELVYRSGSRRTTDVLTLYFRLNGTTDVRLGLSVGRRFGTAVVRNRLRRRIRGAVHAHRRGITQGYDLVMSPRERAAGATYVQLHDAVGRALASAGIVRSQLDPR